MPQIRLTLPFPPSLNRLFRRRKWQPGMKGPPMFRSPEYRSWLTQATAAWWQQKSSLPVKMISGPFNANLIFFPPPRRRSADADNRMKSLMDFLQSAGIIEDDKFQRVVTSDWRPDHTQEPGVEIVIESVP